jgi:hypothetical protein
MAVAPGRVVIGRASAAASRAYRRGDPNSARLADFIRRAPAPQLEGIIDEIARRSEGRTALVRAVARLQNNVTHPSPDGIETHALMREAGELLSSAQVAARLSQTRQNVNELLKRGRILGLRFGSHWKFPSLQFREHELLPGLAPVLHSMGDINPWHALDILLSPLDDPARRPIEMLRRGEKAAALATASRAAAHRRHATAGSDADRALNTSLDADIDADVRRDHAIDELIAQTRTT